MQPLRPRAVAVLCALRQGSRTTRQLRAAIGDEPNGSTFALLNDMATERTGALIDKIGDHHWYVDHAGLSWLQTNGLDVVDAARLWNAPGRR